MKRLPGLPAERALKVIGGRWKLLILWHVLEGPQRLSALERLIPGVTQKVLIQQLREMEAHGLVAREVFAVVPARVEYRATPLGRSLAPIAEALCEWGRRHAGELDGIEEFTCDLERPSGAPPLGGAERRSGDGRANDGRSTLRPSVRRVRSG